MPVKSPSDLIQQTEFLKTVLDNMQIGIIIAGADLHD